MPAPLPNDARTLTSAGVTVVTTADGEIGDADAIVETGSVPGGTGLYHRDRRLVRGMRLRFDGRPPRRLNGARTGPSTDRLTYGLWDGGPDPAAIVVRERTVGTDADGPTGYHERLVVQAFRRPVRSRLQIELDSGHARVYDLDTDGSTGPSDRWLASALWCEGGDVVSHGIVADLMVEPGRPRSLRWGVAIDADRLEPWPTTPIEAADPRLRSALRRAAWDLEALTVVEPITGRRFTGAGAPHFLALFGRDTLLASLLGLIAGPERAMETVELLAELQGHHHDPATIEAPGRILHEHRIGDMGVFGLEPGVPYYGSVDATPLLVVVLAECLRWGVDRSRVAALMPAARAAVDWCRRHVDPLGFVHSIPHEGGITNQGWKDSGDSMVRADGSLVAGRTSLVEVQGYVHQALCDLAELEEIVGDPAAAPGLRDEARRLAERFDRYFVTAHPPAVALALDGEGSPLEVRASNAGHLLATNLIDDRLAVRLADRLLDDVEFTGWGIRTLAASEPAYNPLGYHLGTVWPHDNALILRGLSKRRLDHHTRTLAGALLDLAAALGGELPELLGGFDRRRFPEPLPYPASARPQAWAAAVPYQIVSALLGLGPELHEDRLHLRPILGAGQRLGVTRLRLGERTLSIEAEGSEARVTGDTDGLSIILDDRPDPPVG